MTSLGKLAVRLKSLINIQPVCRTNVYERFYSVFPKTYVDPVIDKKVQKEMEESGALKEILHLPIKPAFTPHTSSEFYDALTNKFLNHLTKEGNKKRARYLLLKTFENIKRIQIKKYNTSTNPEEKQGIEIDPRKILSKAIDNASPVLELSKMKRGGNVYQVPVPVSDKRSQFLAIKWLIEAGSEKDMHVKFPDRLCYELIDASKNTGRVIRKKQELYRQCEANRSYAHFRWT